jgi:transposase
MTPISAPVRRRILQLYQRGKSNREIAQFFGFCVAAVRRVRQLFQQRGTLHPRTHLSGRRTLLTNQQRLQELLSKQPRRHAGRVGRPHGPVLPNFHDGCMASADGLEV